MKSLTTTVTFSASLFLANFTCPSPPSGTTPGNSVTAEGSVFNPTGQAGTVYAGNPGTHSLANAQSSHAVSQYDIACFQQIP